ncbi:MAG: DnaD domain-containing protein [Moorellales bacterium]
MAMQVAALCYCNKYLTDGFIPREVVPTLLNLQGLGMRLWQGELIGGGEEARWELIVRDLIEAGIWEEVEGGYRIHDYLDYQPSKAEVLAEREQKRLAGQKGGQASAQARAQASAKQVLKQNTSTSQANGQAEAQAKSKPVPESESVTESDKDRFSISDTQEISAAALDSSKGESEGETKPPPQPNLFALLEAEFGRPLSPLEVDYLTCAEQEYPHELIREAARRASLAGRPNMRYIDGILRSWRKQNLRTLREVQAYEAERETARARDAPGTFRDPITEAILRDHEERERQLGRRKGKTGVGGNSGVPP